MSAVTNVVPRMKNKVNKKNVLSLTEIYSNDVLPSSNPMFQFGQWGRGGTNQVLEIDPTVQKIKNDEDKENVENADNDAWLKLNPLSNVTEAKKQNNNSINITQTKNKLKDLKRSLNELSYMLSNNDDCLKTINKIVMEIKKLEDKILILIDND